MKIIPVNDIQCHKSNSIVATDDNIISTFVILVCLYLQLWGLNAHLVHTKQASHKLPSIPAPNF